MPRIKSHESAEKQYSPEFKLSVVLEFIRAPRCKKRICTEHKIGTDLLDQWYQEFSTRAATVFSSTSGASFQAAKLGSITPIEPADKPSWGIRINKAWHNSICSPSTPYEQPKWLKSFDRRDWDKRGLIIWDNTVQRLEFVYARQALELLDTLRQTTKWRKAGIPLTWRGFALDLLQEPKPKRPREQKQESAHPEQVVFRLNHQASLECFTFLEEHTSLLKQLAEEDEKDKGEALMKVYGILLRSAHEQDEKKIDLASRPLPWVRAAERPIWVCDQPPNRGTVALTQDGWFWRGCIEQPDRFKHESPCFLDLNEALAWTEEKLIALQNPPAEGAEIESERERFREPFQPEADLAPYRIDPASLEPERKLFRVAIILECHPESSKTMEMSFGKLLHYDKKYPTPSKLMRDLHLDAAPIIFEEIAGPHSGLYQIYSAAMYYQEMVAAQQAQQLWDQSTIVQKFQEGKIKWAQYGYEEVETDYCIWLGMLDDPEHPSPAPSSREEHMQNWAMELTLIHALALNDYRHFRQLPRRWLSDEKLLVTMHEKRAQSKHIPAAARAESEQWLREHPRKSDA